MNKALHLIFVLIFFSNSIYATHAEGGEITWKNYGNGKFVFEVTIFFNCNSAILTQPTITLSTNNPSYSANGILCSLKNTIDISPVGVGCPSCSNTLGSTHTAIKNIYKSDTLLLNGITGPSGWHFTYSLCCRNAIQTNVVNQPPFGNSIILNAMMYSYNSTAVELINDNSAYFINDPTLVICIGNETFLNNIALDKDLDSTSITWDYLYDSFFPNTIVPYSSGYSIISPLPSTIQNPLNTAVILNNQTGTFSLRSFTTGNFFTIEKVSSYKCGQLTSEVSRNITLQITNNCVLTTTPAIKYNTNPTFKIDTTYLVNGNFAATILAGDSIHYIIQSSDLDSTSGIPQTNLTTGFGLEFGDNFSDPNSGCPLLPCATTNPPLPLFNSTMNTFSFDWRTSCLHTTIINGCLKHSQTYIFTFKSSDDFCPVNGITYQTLSLTVTGPIIQTSGADLYISAPGSTFQWYLDGVAIAGATDSIYTPTVQGIYSVIATNGNGCSLISNALPRTFTSIENTSTKEFSMNIAPNPIDKNGLSLLISSPTAIQMNVQIVDQLGRSVYNQVVNVNQGDQHIILDPGILATGIYTIQMMNGKNSIEKKFVVN